MFLNVEPTSAIPMYRQLMDQIRFAVASKRLAAEEKLPSVRDLAAELQINLQTVVKAYSELVREGTLVMRRGMGTYVSSRPPARSGGRAQEALHAKVKRLCQDAYAYGLSVEHLHKMIEKTWHKELKR